jgi:isopentenyldiphosphate isomerase
MQKLRSQINESFFNPILHFLPLFIYIVMEDFYDSRIAWMVALPVSLLLLFYIYFVYKKLFEWFIGSTLIFIAVVIIIGLLSNIPFPAGLVKVESEYVVLVLFVVSLVFRKKIEAVIEEKSSKRVSMINNLNELFRMIWILGSIIFVYTHVYTIISIYGIKNADSIKQLVDSIYISSLVFVFSYEVVRVSVIRIGLLREEWWPIVSEKGKVIGHIQHALSLNDQRKYMHPVVRVIVVENNKILLQKRKSDMLVFPNMWDAAISNHVRMGETVEQCMSRTAKERFGVEEFKAVLLSNYTLETQNEFHYAFLFVACKIPEISPNPKFVDHVKWWTLQQIEDNLDSDIFTENFLIELDIIKRSGLLNSGVCDCECRLKDVVSNFTRQN